MEQVKVGTVVDQANVVRQAGAVGTWSLQPDRSTIGFSVKNFWGLAKVKGRFTKATGRVDVDADGSMQATLDIDAASVDTKQAKRDKHLRSKDFFDVENFPTMRVQIDRVALGAADKGRAYGRLTILGQTRPVEFDVAVTNAVSGSAEVTGTLTVDRSAYGMSWRPMKMAGLDVTIDVRLNYRKTSA